VARTQDAEPVVAALRDGAATIGWFTGLVIKRLGLRILGSPFPGWTTGYMGFNLDDGVPRRAAVEALLPFAYRKLGCIHLELKDRWLELRDLDGLGFAQTPTTTYDLDLTRTQEELFGGMTSACRRAVRKSEKEGVTIEEAADLAFADDYYTQLLDVFGRQSLRPPYGVERVRELIRTVQPSGKLLLLRARDADGRCVATGIFPGHGRTAYFWGGASLRAHQGVRPNEAIFWHAMRSWKERGATVLDMGGGGDYKRKYGPVELTVPWFRRARVPGLLAARDVAEKALTRGRR
jgi:hypothetical protein